MEQGLPEIERYLRYNLYAESGVIGALVVDSSLLPQAFSNLKEDDFFNPENRRLFRLMHDSYNECALVTPPLVIERIKTFDQSEELERRFLSILSSDVSTVGFSDCISIVKKCSLMRKIHEVGNRLIRMSASSEHPSNIIESAERMLFQLANVNDYSIISVSDKAKSAADYATKILNKSVRLGSGCKKLDEIWELRKGEVTVVAARPGVGKTSFVVSTILNFAPETKVLFFTLEMSSQQIILRMLANCSEVDMHRFHTNQLSNRDISQLADAVRRLSKVNVFLSDVSSVTVSEVKNLSRSFFARHGLDVIFIDYIQLMDAKGNFSNRQEELAKISKELKSLSRELDVPLVILSQLSRATEQTRSRRPLLWHLKSSGSMEEHFDNVLFLYRKDYYYDEVEPGYVQSGNKSEIIVAKQRNGPTGSVFVKFFPACSKFLDDF